MGWAGEKLANEIVGLSMATKSVTCGCGKRIVQLKDTEFWRLEESGEVCNDGHWHKPMESALPQPVAAQEKCPQQFRKKPVVIEALQYDGTNQNAIKRFTQGGCYTDVNDPNRPLFMIRTLEGEHVASVGDYIIKGVKGEFYPCKPEIFDQTYEPEIPSPAATTQPEPKSAPQAEGFDEWLMAGQYKMVEYNTAWQAAIGLGDEDETAFKAGFDAAWDSCAQAPLLAKIAELEKKVQALKLAGGLSCELHGCLSTECTTQQYLKDAEEMITELDSSKARIAELESAQPKAEPVEKLVSDESLSRMIILTGQVDSVWSKEFVDCLRELQQRRQREERRGE
jgi:hypothetical protein